MTKISISEAWSNATAFFNGQHPAHAIILIGLGVVGPFLLTLLLGGTTATVATNPTSLAEGALSAAAFGGTVLLISLLSFILQMGSYLASWRLGLSGDRETVGSAIGYGLIAALPVLLVMIAIILVMGIVVGVLFGASAVPLLTGATSPDAGMGFLVLLAIPVLMLFGLWLTARLCCMGPAMANKRTFNPITGLTDSWRMTGPSQWKLMAYFVLVLIVLVILSMLVAMVAGVSMLAGADPGGAAFGFAMLLGALVGIPMAYLYVAVPAGIFRALGGTNASDVFA